MANIRQKIWLEEVLPDSIRVNLLTTPDTHIISSATSNYQRQPGAIVLLDHKYPLIGVQEVEVIRSRDTSSNTARISLLNMDTRYSGPNRHKIAANVPVSIFYGYDGKYLQKYEGFIDTISMNTVRTASIITINCRDRAKMFLEQTISAGIYSDKSTYLGYEDWHFSPEWTPTGLLLKKPKVWKVSDILVDICYHMSLRDITDTISIEEIELPTGAFRYERRDHFRAEFEIEVAESLDRDLVTNFVEEAPLDCLSKVVQTILHEVVFDTDGVLRVRPVKTANSPARFYFKEERDIARITENTDDDNIVNVVSVIGQTADETAIIYPFGPVAVKTDLSLSKGQDLYGQAITYPAVVSPESVAHLHNHLVYAPVIYPDGASFTPADNPENHPQFDIRMKYPNFANGHKKQQVLEATCPIVTDTAGWASVGNQRLWMFYGALEEAVAFEKQPIMLKDRFGKPMLVVCKQRSMDEDLIRACGNTPFDGTARPEDDPDAPPTPIPTDFYMMHARIVPATNGQITITEVTDPALIPSPFISIYNGNPTTRTDSGGDLELVAGWMLRAGSVPASAPLPRLVTAGMITSVKDIYHALTSKGRDRSDPMDDSVNIATPITNLAFFNCTRDIEVRQYRNVHTDVHTMFCFTPDLYEYDTISFRSNFITSPVTSGCSIELSDRSGIYGINIPYTMSSEMDSPADWIPTGIVRTETISYTAALYEESGGRWTFAVWSISLDSALLPVAESITNTSEVRTLVARIPSWFAAQGDPDTNCIYWAWHGGLSSGAAGVGGLPPNSLISPAALALFSGNPVWKGYAFTPSPFQTQQGVDWLGYAPALITKDAFYKYAQDPNVTVVEILTSGLQLKSWAEVVNFNENIFQAMGYNQYGSMEDEMRDLMNQINQALMAIRAAIVFLAAVTWKAHFGTGMGVIGMLAILFLLTVLMGDLGAEIGRDISKVMEDMTGKVHGIRREEIHLAHNAGQAATWILREPANPETGEWPAPAGTTMQHGKFAYMDTGDRPCWVYIMRLDRAGLNGITFGGGSWVTSFGWETPEVGDRSFINYYENLVNPADTRRELTMQFSIEAFGDDLRSGFSAEYLMAKRFEHASFGLASEPGDTWMNSSYYEVLVDRSMTDVAVTDTGWWWEFFERKDDYTPRVYKYVAVIIYDITETVWLKNNGGRVGSPMKHVTAGSTPVDSLVMSTQRWGFYISRGLNPSWYSQYRWLDPMGKVEQNYLNFKVLHCGQNQLVAHIYNNFRYSPVTVDVRIWGKAYGKFAPSIVYYHETDQLSMNSYGTRELRLVNNCINDFKTARYLATKLASQSAHTYVLETTGKPHIKEGDVVMVKEETTGAVAGMFRTWENIFKDPQTRECTHPADKLQVDEVVGVYLPQISIPTTGNNTLVACGDQTRQAYLLELDKTCNPIWWAKIPDPATPSFVLRWYGAPGTAEYQVKTIVGLRYNQTVAVIDYAKAQVIERFYIPAQVLCGCLDEEQKFLYVGTAIGITCIDLQSWSLVYQSNIGPVYSIAATNNPVWDPAVRDYKYGKHGVLFCLQDAGVCVYQIFSTAAQTQLGPLLTTYSDLPLHAPVSLAYDKFINELVVVNSYTTTQPSMIHGVYVDVFVEPDKPDIDVEVEFGDHLWAIDFMEDAELKHFIPEDDIRRSYINRFFTPVYAVRDVNRDLLITDTEQNRVYRVNPSGKLYVVKIADRWSRSNDADEYRCTIEAVPVEAALSLQLTNFGQNFIQQKTDEQIEGKSSIGMGRIISALARNRYLVKLLTSSTVVEAYNNSLETDLKIHDTVLLAYNYGERGICAIIAKKSLWDWTIETGDPYVSIDATNIDLSKYGQDASETGAGAGNTDLGPLLSRLRVMEYKIKQLGGFHGITW